ncbi:MAG: gliding motility-associated C-terminal domain-containing protein [Saprospiraceae bacterium]|nr:gliding motility-associated C-terminal domain-containing protein [Saprospiraceae bacterium]
MSKRLLLLAIVMLFLVPFGAKATHIVGGEMNYKCLGNDVYEIKLTIFRDCYNGEPWFDAPAAIGVFSNLTNQLVATIYVPLDSMLNDTLDPVLNNPCLAVPPNVCVHTTTYTAIDTLPYIVGGYHLAYQRCCRNRTITNLILPDSVGATYSIILDSFAMTTCNSSPVFNNWPPLYLCVNEPFEIDQSAVDPDGDSLVYRLCDPLTGATPSIPRPQPPNNPPYLPVPWFPTYNANNQIGGPPFMAIDPNTGLLTGIPQIIGQFVIGICVEEYRGGVFMGSKRRDYQVNIGQCAVTTASFFAPEVICKGLTVNLDNQSINANDYAWFFNDPTNPNATSNLENPTYTYPDTGLYNITLISEPGTVCADTFSAPVQLNINSLFADFEISNVECEEEFVLTIANSSIDTLVDIVDWNWTLEQGSNTWTDTVQHPMFRLDSPGPALLSLIVTAENGCLDTFQQEIPVVIFNNESLADSLKLCLENGAVQLNPDSAYQAATFNWFPPDWLDNSNSINPTATPDTSIVYQVILTDATGFCEVERRVFVFVPAEIEIAPLIDTILRGESVQLTATFDPNFSFDWTPSNSLDSPNEHDPTANPKKTTGYTLQVIDGNGCIIEKQLLIVVLTLCEEPFIFIPTGFTPNGDGKNDMFKVFGNDLTEANLIVYDRWGEQVFESNDPSIGWDGTYKGKQLPPDVYGFYAIVKCEDGQSFAKKGNVTLMR